MIRDNNCALGKCSNVLHPKYRKFRRLSPLAFIVLISFSMVCFSGCADSNAEFKSLQKTCENLKVKVNAASKSLKDAVNDAKNKTSQISAEDVEDSSVLDNLNSLFDEVKNEDFSTISCLADNANDIKNSNKELNNRLENYKDKTKQLQQASDDVQVSYRKHVLSEAKKIADDAVGKVKDPKVIDNLNEAINNNDIDAIPDAVKAVNESIEAKNKEDEEARKESQKKRLPATVRKQPTNNVNPQPQQQPQQQPQTNQGQVSQNYVHPGSFCSQEGATGVTTKGTPMVCISRDGDRPRWRRG
ncbi:hypothetical protein CG404_04720 [Bifidobacteriaceae bacterium VN003]|nr:hypothetical protein CG404_04720 [Bifidobacteriaceae bacterium VN003]